MASEDSMTSHELKLRWPSCPPNDAEDLHSSRTLLAPYVVLQLPRIRLLARFPFQPYRAVWAICNFAANSELPPTSGQFGIWIVILGRYLREVSRPSTAPIS